MSLIAVAAIFLLARLAPPLEGLSAQGQGVLGAMVAGAVLWITEATPIGLTAIIVVVLLALCPDISLSAAGSGLASEVVFFLIGSVAIGAAVEASGLAEPALQRAVDAAFDTVARVHRLMSFHDPLSDIARVVDVLPGAAGALAMGGRAMIVELQGDADDVVAFRLQ